MAIVDNNPRHLPVAIQALILVAVAAMLADGAFFFGIPGVLESPWRLAAQKDTLETRARDLKSENDAAEDVLRDRSTYQAGIEATKEKLDGLSMIVPPVQSAEEFKKLVNRDAVTAAVHPPELVTQPLVVREFYSEGSLKGHLEGRYDSVTMFFARLEKERRLISVSNLALRPLSAGKMPNSRIRPTEPVDATFVLTTYFSKPEKRP